MSGIRTMRATGAMLGVALFCGAAEAGENWPDFRGPTHDGRTDAPALPTKWDEATNVRWKTPIHDIGWSTPAIQDGRIWMTSATEEGKEFFAICVDARSGGVVHDLKLFEAADPEPLGNDVNCYASPSPASESGRVYIHFGTYGSACLDSESGRTIWTREDLHCLHFRGPGSSPFIYKNLLVLTYDGIDAQFVVALDKATGQTIWRTDRTTDFMDLDDNGRPKIGGDFRKAYTTPIIYAVEGKPRLLSVGARSAFAYDPETGEELWKVRYPGYSNASRPLRADGLALINTGYGTPELWAVRTDGTGDVTDTNIAWKYDKAVSKRSSPALAEGLVYMVAENGIAACIEAATGRELWRERLKGQFTASPLIAGEGETGRVYFFSEGGETFVVAAGGAFLRIAENKLEEGMMASPGVTGKALILRTRTHVYRIEDKEEKEDGITG